MFDAARILEPLDAERGRLAALEAHGPPAELSDAVCAAAAAVETALRRLLAQDTVAPDEVRLIARSPEQLPFDRLIPALTRTNRISLALAGEAHALRRAAERAAAGATDATDADTARSAIQRLRVEVAALELGGGTGAALTGTGATARAAASELDAAPVVVEPPSAQGGRRWRYVLGALVLALLVWAVWPRHDPLSAGIAAFPDRLDEAEAEFLVVLEDEPANVTARLYLGRIYRRQGRYDEAASMLSGAAASAPADADVRRELGYLFLDLNQPDAAIEQMRRAQQSDPQNELNWIALIRALRAAGDPEADVVLSRAPANVRDMFGAPVRPDSGAD